MLLPSDVARLVLGYLQEEGLAATSQAFIHESPNLKEYADHTTGDGTIPACMFSLFGKGLTTILNEYVATKTKESRHEIPAVMTSLWKKLDFTLNQIKSLQNTPAISSSQRTRSRIGVANMARQRSLTVASASTVVCSSITETSSIVSPAHTVLSHSTPVSYPIHRAAAAGGGTQQQIPDVRLNTPRDSPVQMIVSEHRLNPGPMSPGRRKWDTPRKRAGAVSGSSGAGRFNTTASGFSAEPQLEEVVDENFPQLVIQNARDKILGDRSLQEKLAENINKILGSDPMPQTAKTSSSTVEADQSIDEILGLQGELHMSDDAIHDILEQTESDPAFQALYDLFDYNKTKLTDGEPADGDDGGIQEVSGAAAGPMSVVRPLQSEDPGTTLKDANVLDVTPSAAKGKTAQERKTRKSATLLKKIVLGPKGRSSRIENSSATLLVSQGGHHGASPAAEDTSRKEKIKLPDNSVFTSPMDIDEPLHTPPAPLDGMAALEPAAAATASAALAASTPVDITGSSAAALEAAPALSVDRKLQDHGAQPAFLPPAPVVPNNAPSATVHLPQIALCHSEVETHRLPAVTESASSTSVSTAAPFTATSDSPKAVSTSAITTTAASSARTSPAPSAGPQNLNAATAATTTTPDKSAADSGVVSLKIIITDNQEEDPASDPALARPVSSVCGDKIPTIYLTSPARTTVAAPGTPKASLDETAQAVSGLQNSEVQASPLGSKAGAFVAAPLTETSQVPQNYIIQLPMDANAPAIPGSAPSYFLVTEPPNADGQVLLSAGVPNGQPLPINQYGVTTQTCPQGFSAGSTLILQSPAKPVMLPVSVMGQNTLGRVQMVSNQLVTVPNAVTVPAAEAVKSKSPTVAIQWSTAAGTEPQLVGKLVKNAAQQDAQTAAKHKRILCFDSPADVQPQTAKTTTAASSLHPATKNPASSRPVQPTQRDNKSSATRTRPTILGGNKPKRRVQTVRCSAGPQTDGGVGKELASAAPTQQHQNDPDKKNLQNHSVHNQEAQPAGNGRAEAAEKNPESETRRPDRDSDAAKATDSQVSTASFPAGKSESRKEKEESKKDLSEKAPVKPREGRTEKRAPSPEGPNVTANKENEIKGSVHEQPSTPSSSASRDFSPQTVTQTASNPQAKAPKPASKTSSLAKQAAEMLHDIQGLNSPSSPAKRAAAANSDLSPAVRGQEEAADCLRTPSRQKKGKDGEGTPKHLLPPNTPDVPTCSPASEAGSENSINMAAHTLMILSRAAIARAGTPLKDSLRQEGAEKKSPTSGKISKKRKMSSPTASPPAKKDRERKKLMDCFPHDLDVDKFLSSLHYDE